MKLLIKNATIVNEGRQFKGHIAIDGDSITDVVEENNALPATGFDEVIDAEGMLLLPGLIDTHVHFREPGLTHKADFASESKAALAGGVTSVFDMPNTIPQTTNLEAWNEKREIAKKDCLVNYAIFFGATSENIEQLPLLNPQTTPGIKLFMGSSTGNMLVDDDATLHKIFAAAELPIVAHCEDTDIINANMKAAKEKHGNDPDVSLHPVIRSREACLCSTKQAIDLARHHGKRLHLAHLTTKEELTLFETNKELDDSSASSGKIADELPLITAEVCVPHLIFTDADYHTLGARIKCNPAVKSEKDRTALRQALNDGRIFSIATDHAPHLLEEKQGGASKAMSGMPMLQFSLVALLNLCDKGCISLERIAELTAHHPAQLFQIEKRGFLRKGYKADLVLVKAQKWELEKNCILSKCGWSPLEGRSFGWKVCKTIVNGHIAYDEGSVRSNLKGEELRFER